MTIVKEIQEALVQVQSSLDQGKSLSESDMQLLFIVALAEEASRGQS